MASSVPATTAEAPSPSVCVPDGPQDLSQHQGDAPRHRKSSPWIPEGSPAQPGDLPRGWLRFAGLPRLSPRLRLRLPDGRHDRADDSQKTPNVSLKTANVWQRAPDVWQALANVSERIALVPFSPPNRPLQVAARPRAGAERRDASRRVVHVLARCSRKTLRFARPTAERSHA